MQGVKAATYADLIRFEVSIRRHMVGTFRTYLILGRAK